MSFVQVSPPLSAPSGHFGLHSGFSNSTAKIANWRSPAQWLVFVDLADGRRESFDLAAASLAAEPVPLQATGE